MSVLEKPHESKKLYTSCEWRTVFSWLAKEAEILRLIWVSHHNQRYMGKKKLHYLGNSWMNSVEHHTNLWKRCYIEKRGAIVFCCLWLVWANPQASSVLQIKYRKSAMEWMIWSILKTLIYSYFWEYTFIGIVLLLEHLYWHQPGLRSTFSSLVDVILFISQKYWNFIVKRVRSIITAVTC